MIMEQYLNEMEEYNRINPEMIELTEGVDGHFR